MPPYIDQVSAHFKEIKCYENLRFEGAQRGEPIILVGVLHSIRKEVCLLRGDMKLCSLSPVLLPHVKENHLDRMFTICKKERMARKNMLRTYGGG
jgi:hypothetical protein